MTKFYGLLCDVKRQTNLLWASVDGTWGSGVFSKSNMKDFHLRLFWKGRRVGTKVMGGAEAGLQHLFFINIDVRYGGSLLRSSTMQAGGSIKIN